MRKLFLFFVVLLFATSSFASKKPAIIPMPAECNISGGCFYFPKQLSVLADEAHQPMINQIFERAAEFGFDIKYKFVKSKSKSGNLILNIDPTERKNNAEGYNLTITQKNITIEAPMDNGLFYGLQTLLQLIVDTKDSVKNLKVSCLTIADAPTQGWRGIMLDESRYFLGTETVKQLLDWMAFYKLNKFHWHLTDTPGWRLEIKKYPKLTTIGGIGNHSDSEAPAMFYTQDEVKEIIRYADERFIEVIPEIDMPGHAAASNRAYPEYSGGGSENYPEFTFNPAKEDTYGYLTDILREVAELFPSEYIHIGGDEVHFGNHQWTNIPEVQKLMEKHSMTDLQEVEYYFINRMADSIQALNKKMIGWDEIVNAKVAADQSLVMWWRHDQPGVLQKALDMDYKIILCPRIPLYFDFVQHDSHTSGRRWAGDFATLEQIVAFNRTYSAILSGYPNHILGIQANLWTETIATTERLNYMTFPRIAALSEAAWVKKASDYEEFIQRLLPSLSLYEKLDIPFFNPLNIEITPEIKGPSE